MTEVAERPVTEQEAIYCLNSLIDGYILLEELDVVCTTSFYKHGLKEKVKRLIPDLEKHCDQLQGLFNVDDSAMYNLMEHKKTLLKQIAAYRPERCALLSEVMKQFFNAPELTSHRLGIRIEKQNP